MSIPRLLSGIDFARRPSLPFNRLDVRVRFGALFGFEELGSRKLRSLRICTVKERLGAVANLRELFPRPGRRTAKSLSNLLHEYT
jgi:hypothetical protein